MDKITRGYCQLIKRISKFTERDFYNQLKRTGKNRDDIEKIKNTCSKLQEEIDYSLNFYLYKEDRWLQMDIYSRSGYEGSIRGGNLKHIYNKICKIYSKLLSLLNLK